MEQTWGNLIAAFIIFCMKYKIIISFILVGIGLLTFVDDHRQEVKRNENKHRA